MAEELKFKKYPKIRQLGHKENEGILDGELCIEEKIDGCFDYKTPILLEDFSQMSIGKIVNERLPVKVLSYNIKTKKIEPKKVVNWFKNGLTNNWKTLVIKGKTISKKKEILVTPNHKIYTNKGIKKVSELKIGEKVFFPKHKLNQLIEQLILGSLLGDSCMKKNKEKRNPLITTCHSKKQKDYLYLKRTILDNFFSTKEDSYISGYGSKMYRVRTNTDVRLEKFYKLCYKNCKKKVNNKWMDNLSLLGLSFWYLDDGSIAISDKQKPRITFHTQGFSLEENKIIIKSLKKKGYDANICKHKDKQHITLTTDASEKFIMELSLIFPNYRNKSVKGNSIITLLSKNINDLVETEILEIRDGKKECYKNNKKYDIEVEDNHNYFASKVLVSNSNFRFMFKGKRIIFGSRTQQLTSNEGDDSNVGKNFRRCIGFIRETVKNSKKQKLKGLMFFGENCIKHSYEYDWDKIPPFLGFDVYDLKKEQFIDFKKKHLLFKKLGLPSIESVIGVWGKDITEKSLEIPMSDYADNLAEGIVIKNYKKQIFAKKVSDKFREINRKTFGTSKKWAKDDTEWYVSKYCTNARIDKHIFKAVDDGNELDLKLMSIVPNAVYRDIWEECWEEIAFSKKIINLNKFKKMVSGRCLAVVKQVMTNTALGEKDAK